MMISIILKDLDFLLNFNFLQKKTFLLKKGVIKKLVGAVEVKICQAKKSISKFLHDYNNYDLFSFTNIEKQYFSCQKPFLWLILAENYHYTVFLYF